MLLEVKESIETLGTPAVATSTRGAIAWNTIVGLSYCPGSTAVGDESVSPLAFNIQNLRGQNLLFRCLETGFVTTAPALGRYQYARGIYPSRRELVG